MEIIRQCTIKAPDAAVAAFPGAARLSNGDIILHFGAASDFESSDKHMMQARSCDNGNTWQVEQCIAATDCLKTAEPFTFNCKPVLLDNGSIIAAGYGFLRDRPDMGLSDYAEKFKRFPTVGNYLLRSNDNGKTYSAPEKIVHQYKGLEISGPVLCGRDGKLRIFATPFELNAAENLGVTLISDNYGKTWQEGGKFFRSGNIAPWEVRSVELSSGRIMLVFWAFDLKEQKHLNNHIVFSDDGGISWSAPIDTNLRGQASNWVKFGEKTALLQARREGENPGIYLNILETFDGITPRFAEDICLWDASGKANSGVRIEEQFAALKFGQPSGLVLDDGTWLLIFWCKANDNYTVQAWKIKNPFVQ